MLTTEIERAIASMNASDLGKILGIIAQRGADSELRHDVAIGITFFPPDQQAAIFGLLLTIIKIIAALDDGQVVAQNGREIALARIFYEQFRNMEMDDVISNSGSPTSRREAA